MWYETFMQDLFGRKNSVGKIKLPNPTEERQANRNGGTGDNIPNQQRHKMLSVSPAVPVSFLLSVHLRETASEREESTVIKPYTQTPSLCFLISILSASKPNNHF